MNVAVSATKPVAKVSTQHALEPHTLTHTQQFLAVRAPELLRTGQTEQPHPRVLGPAVHQDVEVELLRQHVVVYRAEQGDEEVRESVLAVRHVHAHSHGDLLRRQGHKLTELVGAPEDYEAGEYVRSGRG